MQNLAEVVINHWSTLNVKVCCR